MQAEAEQAEAEPANRWIRVLQVVKMSELTTSLNNDVHVPQLAQAFMKFDTVYNHDSHDIGFYQQLGVGFHYLNNASLTADPVFDWVFDI